tara:strand:- start:938 stop:1162 length:225 start_codon:yes stop_codon:yes gene_type:complete
MPYMKPYTAKHFEGMADNGKMSDVPDGMLYREALESDIIGSTDVDFKQSADVPTESGKKQMTANFMKEDNSIYG